ncbi:hypothetical protein M2161_000629 [Streptomyces sp. SAI-133]|uniref:ATP-binding protein n=1 Tax=Streptomyces sp. SAI-133 TaxID=2940547 RepID=UPI00247CF6B4|nr:hypothetical protein [Streptomyces sp. SAI-133]
MRRNDAGLKVSGYAEAEEGVGVMYPATGNLISPVADAAAENRSGPTTAEATNTPDGPPHIPVPQPRVDDFSWLLTHCPKAARAARKIAAVVLAEWHTSEEATDTALLVVSELVTNAVEHAQPPVTLHLHRERAGSRVWVGVSDGGPAEDAGPWISSCSDDEHGRGLEVVGALATAHGTRHHSGGITRWARLQTTAS